MRLCGLDRARMIMHWEANPRDDVAGDAEVVSVLWRGYGKMWRQSSSLSPASNRFPDSLSP